MNSLPPGSADGTPRVLVFSAFRFWEDRDLLAATGAVELIEAPTATLQAVNGLFRTRTYRQAQKSGSYLTDVDADVLCERRLLVDFAALILLRLRRRVRFDAVITPAIFYEYEIPWAQAATRLGIPFIGLHKEFTVLSRRNMLQRVERYMAQQRRFHGSRVLVVNECAKELFVRGGVAEADQVEVVGLPRMDRLFDPNSPFRERQANQPQVSLFSFGHYSGDLEPGERRSRLFSRWDHEGFVRLFDEVHGSMGRLALRHPEVRFVIKPKSLADWWVVEIDRAIEQATGCRVDEIPNCEIVDGSAQELIRDSIAVIGFNSTVLLEARILDRPTVVPLFAEAVGRHRENIYLEDALDLFHVADSRDGLEQIVEAALDGTAPARLAAPEREREVMQTYLGFDDAGATGRVIAAIRSAVGAAAQVQ